jgi:hypothetical protein
MGPGLVFACSWCQHTRHLNLHVALLIAKDVLTKESVQLQRYAAGQTTGKELSPIQLVP